ICLYTPCHPKVRSSGVLREFRLLQPKRKNRSLRFAQDDNRNGGDRYNNIASYSSLLSKSSSLGLYFSLDALRLLVSGSARVGGGVPTTLRAAALTAFVAEKRLGLRFFAAIRLRCGLRRHPDT